MKNQDRFKWFLAFNQEQNYEIPSSFVFDTEKLYDTVSNLKCMLPENTTEPMDAQIQETKEGFEIVPETEGTALKKEEVQNLIAQAIVLGTTSVDLEAEGCYEYPSVYRDDELLIENCRRMNTLTDVIITYDFADRTETVDKDLIKNWVMEDEDGYYVLDRQTIAAYVSGLAEKYDTFGNSRTFTTYAGVSKIIDGGNYGWIIDQEAETQALMDAIESGVTQVREPVYKQEAWERDSNDIGYTYIEIDLSNQRLVLYMNGTPVVDTYTITGNPNVPGYETPIGCYTIADMQSPATVTGEEYSSVNYWIAFCGNIGINDAAWRNSFGNNIYLFEGSCGCVNISYDAAQQLYQNVSVGMPVVVYE
jgi:lipoprotein-anchoring transpeptidase ErfK/SrfK